MGDLCARRDDGRPLPGAPGRREELAGLRDAHRVAVEVLAREVAEDRQRLLSRVDPGQAAGRQLHGHERAADERPVAAQCQVEDRADAGDAAPSRACRCRGSCRGCRRSAAPGTTRARVGRAGRGRSRRLRQRGSLRGRTPPGCPRFSPRNVSVPAWTCCSSCPSAPACIVTITTSAFRSALRTSRTAPSMSRRSCAQS